MDEAEQKEFDQQLNKAIRKNDLESVKNLLEQGAKPDKFTLNEAVETGKIEIVNVILAHGAKPDEYTLSCAVSTGNIEIVQAVLAAGAKPDKYTLSCAVSTGNIEIVQAVLAAGAKPDKDTLTYAVSTGDVNIVKLVSGAGAKPDKDTLTYAVSTGDVNIVKLVLGAGAKPAESTLSDAIQTGKIEIVKAVLGAGAKPDKNTLFSAVCTYEIKIVNAVLAAGALEYESELNKCAAKGDFEGIKAQISIRTLDMELNLALVYAVISQKPQIVQYIIENGARADNGHLNLAISCGDKAIAEIIKAKGATLNDDSLPAMLNSKNLEMAKLAASWGAVVTKEVFKKASSEMQYKLGLYQASCDLRHSKVKSLLSRFGLYKASPDLPEINALKESLMDRAINGSMLDETQFSAIKDLKSPYVRHVVNLYIKDIVVGKYLPNNKLSPDTVKIISDFIELKDAVSLRKANRIKDAQEGSHADKVISARADATKDGPAR